MSLNAALNLFLEEYPKASQAPFSGNSVAEFIRKDLPEVIRNTLGDCGRYLVHGSPGQGNWARVPWVAIFDRLLTDTAQEHYYIVYLVREDFAGIYLSLNQGVTSIQAQYGGDTKHALEVRAENFVARLGKLEDKLTVGPIDLATSQTSTLGQLYERGAICSIFYGKERLPEEEVLSSDLMYFLDLYLRLVSCETRLFEHADAEDDEVGLASEDLRILREHKRIERNKKLSLQAKKFHGNECQACGFNFEKSYGSIGSGFIEAHHLTPLAKLKGRKLWLDPTTDFAVLCSNCHRMIHRSEFVSSVEGFRAKYISSRSN